MSNANPPIDRVFAYGTLKRGECRAAFWPRSPVRVDKATIRAALYDLGPYPAIGPGDDLVLGEVWEIRAEDMEITLDVLDQIEGYAGRHDDEYVRRTVACTLLSGEIVTAFAYFLARPERLATYQRIHPCDAGTASWSPAGRVKPR